MTIHNLERILRPRSIAVAGAGPEPGSVGRAVMQNLVQSGFAGPILPVNPACREVLDRVCRPSVRDLDEPVDLVVTADPLSRLPDLVADCLAARAGGCVVISASGREGGEKGREGKTALVSQSGAIGAAILDLSLKRRIGLSHLVSLGTMADVDFGDMVDYLGGDPDVKSILLYVEELERCRGFMSAARAVSRIKPIIALKAGRTAPDSPGVPEDAVYEAAFKRAGMLRVRTFEELFDCAELLARHPRLSGPALAIVTNAGGPGLMAADALAGYGAAPAELSLATVMRLDAVLPPGWSRSNPVNIQRDASPERFCQAVAACLQAPEVDGVLVIMAPYPLADPTQAASALAGTLASPPRPVFTVWLGGAAMEKGRLAFGEAGIPTFDTPERAVRAFMNLYRHGRNLEMLQEVPPKMPARFSCDARRASEIVAAEASRGPEGVRALAQAPVGEVLTACGIVMEPPASPAGAALKSDQRGIKLMAGICRSPGFGPVIYFGPGGGMGGLSPDLGIALPPLNRLLARRLMEGSRIHRLLDDRSRCPAEARTALEAVLIRLSQLAIDCPEIRELEINPLKVKGESVLALGARIAAGPAPAPAPFHLVISPYPNQYEARVVTAGGVEILVRPVRPEDAPLFEAFFATLSPRSIYLRFFSPLKELPPRMLARFTQIDYDREVALVAIQENGPTETMIGIARVIFGLGRQEAEFAVLVGDRWHGRGIGAELLKRCLMIAKGMGIQKVWAIVLPENTQMLRLGRKLGFRVERVGGEFELTIDLNDPRIPDHPADWNPLGLESPLALERKAAP